MLLVWRHFDKHQRSPDKDVPTLSNLFKPQEPGRSVVWGSPNWSSKDEALAHAFKLLVFSSVHNYVEKMNLKIESCFSQSSTQYSWLESEQNIWVVSEAAEKDCSDGRRQTPKQAKHNILFDHKVAMGLFWSLPAPDKYWDRYFVSLYRGLEDVCY